MEQSQFFYCETDSLIDMPDLSRHGTKMENSRLWTVQIVSSFTEIRRTVSESHFENLIFTFMCPCIVTNFCLIKPTEALISQIYFC